MATTTSSSKPTTSMPTSDQARPPSTSFTGIDHVKLACSNLQASREFYTTILPLTYMPQFDHFTASDSKHPYAQILIHEPTKTMLEIRHNPDHAQRQSGWDPVVWGVKTRKDMDDWAAWLDANDVKRSRVLTALKSWTVVCEDPDGRMVRFYVTGEEHEWEVPKLEDGDEYWLGKSIPDPQSGEKGT